NSAATIGINRNFTLTVTGNGGTISSGLLPNVTEVPWNCKIVGWRIFAPISGSIVFDIWKDTYANYPPTVADTICPSNKPTLSSANNAQFSTLSGWSVNLSEGDVLAFNVVS